MHKGVFQDISSELANVQEQLQAVLSADELPVDQALRASLHCSGKLLRPGLLLLIAKNGQEPDSGRGARLGCAVEMLHLATLLHDDVIDRSWTRRRRPTAAKVLGDKGSILLGDYLLAGCLRMLVENGEFAALGLLAKTVEMCAEGELLEQANLFNLSLAVEEYMKISILKTAGLFAASCRLGSSLYGHDEVEKDRLTEFGRMFGRGFQMIDDLLDFVGDSESMGKAPGQDLAHGVITLPTILALQGDRAVREPPLRSASGCDVRAVRDPPSSMRVQQAAPLPSLPRPPDSQNAGFGRGEEARIRRLVLEGDALEATIDAARDSFLTAQQLVLELDRSDGLADKLTALCQATLGTGEEALLRFRAKTRMKAEG